MNKIKYPLGWGDPVCIRKALLEEFNGRLQINKPDLISQGYGEYGGEQKLVELTKKFIKNTIGIDYKYLIITDGCTHALSVALSYFYQKGNDIVLIREQHFPYYPQIIKKVGMTPVIGGDEVDKHDGLVIDDSPSNPWGSISTCKINGINTIWDSVYAGPAYQKSKIRDIRGAIAHPAHVVNVGSYSKSFGLAGWRVGWIATNNEEIFKNCFDTVKYTIMNVSTVSQRFMIEILEKTDLDVFHKKAARYIDYNREEMAKLSSLFDSQEVPENGMFYPVFADEFLMKKLEDIGVGFVTLDQEQKLIRFNLAQDCNITKQAVKEIKKL